MIACLMFYALYPLSRLIGRVSELWREAPSVYVNGKEVWDGGGAVCGQQQMGLSLQWSGTQNTPGGPEPRTESLLPLELLTNPLEEEEMNEDLHETLWDVSQTDVNLPESALGPLEDGNDGDPVVNESEVTQSCSDSLSADRHTAVDDCGPEDEALLPTESPVFDLAALLADAQQVQAAEEPVGWHFPVGLGLTQMCYCPYVQLPDASYYPAFQHHDNIEVMWRIWEDLSETRADSRADASAAFDFSVMSYNILSQDLLEANPDLYTHCPEDVLLWENRIQTLLKELQIWTPDIVCLQEVQEDHFLEQMCPVLTDMGYTSIYKRRTGAKTDGCAVCYRGERFTQLSVRLLEFRRSDCELLDRDNVGIVLLLRPTAGQTDAFRPVCVANTHLLFNPRRGDVKLAQLAIMLAEIDVMMKKCGSEGGGCEVILCGDFNALPSSPLWTLITTGQLYYHGLPSWMVSGQTDLSYKVHHRRLFAPLWPSSLGITERCQYNSGSQSTASGQRQYSHDFMRQLRYCEAACVRPADLELIAGLTDKTPDPEEMEMFSPRFSHTLEHSLSLTSAYSPLHPDAQTAVVTTLNSEGGAMVDYIFYSRQRSCSDGGGAGGLKLLGRLSLLSEADLWSLRGLPNETFPSDHLSLLVSLRLS